MTLISLNLKLLFFIIFFSTHIFKFAFSEENWGRPSEEIKQIFVFSTEFVDNVLKKKHDFDGLSKQKDKSKTFEENAWSVA